MSTKKKTDAKKPAAAVKKPAKPAKPAKTTASAPAKSSAKMPARKPAAPAPEEETERKDFVRKPITVVKKTPKPPLKKPEVATPFENHSQDLAFSFAERMKRNQRAADEKKSESDGDVRLSRRPTSRAKGAATLQFPAADLAEFRKRLILLRQEALGQSSTLRSVALEQTNDHGSEDDDGADAYMRLRNLERVNSQNKIVQMIDEALSRIQEGTYGICENCGQLIRKPRLMNLPFVRTCMECQTQMEAPFGGH